MTKPVRDHRQQVMLNHHELHEIDKYRYGMRIPTRAGAMRRLILLGSRAAEQLSRAEQEEADVAILTEAELIAYVESIGEKPN